MMFGLVVVAACACGESVAKEAARSRREREMILQVMIMNVRRIVAGKRSANNPEGCGVAAG